MLWALVMVQVGVTRITSGIGRRSSGQVQPADRFVRRALSWDLEPADVLRLVRDDPHPVALVGAWAAGGAVIGSEPCLTRSPPQGLPDVLDSAPPGAGRGALLRAGGPAPRPRPPRGGAGGGSRAGWSRDLG